MIGAFGLPSNPVEAAAELEERQRTPPLGLAPAYLVHFEETRPKLALRLPARCREIAWTCRLEGGEERGGKAAVETGLLGERFMMPLPGGLAPGYHRLAVEAGGVAAQLDLIVAPARCHLPPQLGPGARSWGLTCQLYGLRSARDWGMGDLTDLASIAAARAPAVPLRSASIRCTRGSWPSLCISAPMRHQAELDSTIYTSTPPLCPALPRTNACRH